MGILQEAYNTEELLADIRKTDVAGKPSAEAESPEEKANTLQKQDEDNKLDPKVAHTLYNLYITLAISLEAPLEELNPLFVPKSLSNDASVEVVTDLASAESMSEAIKSHRKLHKLVETVVDPAIFNPDEIKELRDKWLDWFTGVFKREGDDMSFKYMTEFKEELEALSDDDMFEIWKVIDASEAYQGALTEDMDWPSFKDMFKESCLMYEEFIANGGKDPETAEELAARDDALSADECTNLYGVFKFIKVVFFNGKGTRVLNHPVNLDEDEEGEDFIMELDESVQLSNAADYNKNKDKWSKWANENFVASKGKMYFVQLQELIDGLSDDEKVELLYAMDSITYPNKPIDTPSRLSEVEGWDEFVPYMSNAVDIYEQETFSGEYERTQEQIEQLEAMAGMINAVYGLEATGNPIKLYNVDSKDGGTFGGFGGLQKILAGGLEALHGIADTFNKLSGKKKDDGQQTPPPKPSPEEQARLNLIKQWTPWIEQNLANETDFHMDKVFRLNAESDKFFTDTAEILSGAPDASTKFNELTTNIYNKAQQVAEYENEGTSQLLVNEIVKVLNASFGSNIQIMDALVPSEDDAVIQQSLTTIKDTFSQYAAAFKDVRKAIKGLTPEQLAKKETATKEMTNCFNDYMAKLKKAKASTRIREAEDVDNSNNAQPNNNNNNQQVDNNNNNNSGDNSSNNNNQSQQPGPLPNKGNNKEEYVYTIKDLEKAGGYEEVIELMQKYNKDSIFSSESEFYYNQPEDVDCVLAINPEVKITQLVLNDELADGKSYSLEDLANFALIEPEYQVVVGIMTNPEIFGDKPRASITTEEIEACVEDPDLAIEKLRQDPKAKLTDLEEDWDKSDYQIAWEERTKKWQKWIKGLKGKTSRDVKNTFDALGDEEQGDLLLFLDKTMEKNQMSFEKMNKNKKNVFMQFLPCYGTYLSAKKNDEADKKVEEKLKKAVKESNRHNIVLVADRVYALVETSPFRKSKQY